MENISSKKEFADLIIKRASEDANFRDKLLSNPKEVVEGMLQFKLPQDFEITVHQDTTDKINLVLPYQPDELSEVELNAISGGKKCYAMHCPNNIS